MAAKEGADHQQCMVEAAKGSTGLISQQLYARCVVAYRVLLRMTADALVETSQSMMTSQSKCDDNGCKKSEPAVRHCNRAAWRSTGYTPQA
jgi:hypothetical protein